ncbi:MFS transporter [Erwiniaceae bacterium BAC15a-03b]|uniref:MFS transporter n=1 Tax=Winslowiella arboricola TaxID=2978220 RepID=A0A9J6PQN7_9GAMM|nr:MFS transporter [Winslowiella arboricola]MCU5772524.1 MFS transporter [Winslowiella arboricola]MCU5779046.1 MFS transporter [Winslowiella arboricola]
MNASHFASGANRRGFVLMAACIVAVANPLAFTGPAVALPTIGQTLEGTAVELGWVTNAFMLAFGSCLLTAGSLADALGRRRVFLVGAGLLFAFSLALSVAPNIFIIDLLRAGQGVAAAAAFAGIMAALAQEFQGAGSMRAFSLVGTSFGVGLAFGPISSGLLIAAFGWRSIFVLVAVLAAFAYAMGSVFVRESRDPQAAGIDWKGGLCFTAALALFTQAILVAPEKGWGDTGTLFCLTLSIALFILFSAIELRAQRPMLNLSLFREPRFVAVQLLAAAPAYAFVVLLILLPVRFVGIDGMTALQAGWIMVALCGPLLFLPLIAGLLTRWFSAATLCGTGFVVSAGGLLWLSCWPGGAASITLIAPLLVIGTGISLPWGLMDGLAVSVVPRENAGMATGIFNTTRVAGEGVALAVVSALLSALIASRISTDFPVSSGLAGDTAQRFVAGDLSSVQSLFALSAHNTLAHSYNSAFSSLLIILAVVTLATSLVIFMALRGAARVSTEHAAGK